MKPRWRLGVECRPFRHASAAAPWSVAVLPVQYKSCPRYQSRYLLSIPVSASAAPRGNLDSAKVHQIRTGGLTDSHHGRLFGVSVATVREARIGKTWADHPTPPDMALRTGGGRDSRREAKKRDGSS
jgi:hypothetical protein